MEDLTKEWHRGEFTISTDPTKLQPEVIYRFLSQESYWAQKRSQLTVSRSLENSLNFGLYKAGEQIGFARVVTDFATFAWLADVFVLDEYRGRGLGNWLIETVMSHEALRGLQRWILATRDAHDLYRKFGFIDIDRPDQWMERRVSREE